VRNGDESLLEHLEKIKRVLRVDRSLSIQQAQNKGISGESGGGGFEGILFRGETGQRLADFFRDTMRDRGLGGQSWEEVVYLRRSCPGVRPMDVPSLFVAVGRRPARQGGGKKNALTGKGDEALPVKTPPFYNEDPAIPGGREGSWAIK